MANIETFDSTTADEALLHEVHDLYVATDLEDHPDEPPQPFEQRLSRFRAGSLPHNELVRWLARDNGRVVGASYTYRWAVDDPDNGFVAVHVHPDHRRRGLGRQLLATGLRQLLDSGSSKVILDCVAGRPWETSLEGLGLKHVFTERESALKMADIDWSLMEQWVERASERAGDYELVQMDAPIGEMYLEEWSRIQNVMNTAPREDLDIEDRLMTPERWRAREENMTNREETHLGLAVLHTPSGRFAGYTDVVVQKHHVDLALQMDTAVDPDHRNKGLGRLIKASMITRVAAEHPGVGRIVTGNAGSNAAMLGINVEMGFKPRIEFNAWQGPAAPALANLTG